MKSAFVLGTTLAAAACAALIALPLRAASAQNAAGQNGAGQNAQNKPAPKQEATKGEPAPAATDEKKAESDAAITTRYEKAAAIGEQHKWLGTLAGKWKTVTRQTIKPGAALMESSGTSEFKLLMDGRYLIENNLSAGSLGNSQGMGAIGFNNITQKYERVWFDSHSTAMVKSEGDYLKDRDEIRWTDQWTDPVAGQIITTKSSLRRLDEKHMAFTRSVTLPNKEEFTTLVMQYQKAE